MTVRQRILGLSLVSAGAMLAISAFCAWNMLQLRRVLLEMRQGSDDVKTCYELAVVVDRTAQAYQQSIVQLMMGDAPEKTSAALKNNLAEFNNLITAPRIVPFLASRAALANAARQANEAAHDAAALIAAGNAYGASEKTPFQLLTKALQTEVDASGVKTVAVYANALQDAKNRLSLLAIVTLAILLIAAFYSVFAAVQIERSLKAVARKLETDAVTAESTSSQLKSSSDEQAQRAADQASYIEEASASLTELASMIEDTANHADQLDELAAAAHAHASEGGTATGEMRDAVERIQKSASEMAEIIKTIDMIAFQTNLLALNAAVEAARAGDSGKGFAVVAEEVRNLARRTAEAARKTSDLIEGTRANVEGGVKTSHTVSANLTQIKGSAEKVAELVKHVAAAARQEADGVKQLKLVLSRTDGLVQTHASQTHDTANVADELAGSSANLRKLVDQLVGLIGGRSTAQSDKKS